MDALQFDDDFRDLLGKLNKKPSDLGLISQVCYGLNIRSYHDLCMEWARKGLARDPKDANLYYELIIASSLDTAHILEEILDELEALRDETPQDQGVLRNLALTHYFLEQDEEAEGILLSIIENRDPMTVDRQTYEVLAQLEYTRQNMEQCIYYCDKAIDRPGSAARVVRLKGLCFQELGDLESARRCFHFALELEPCFIWACHSLAGLCLEEEEYDQAFRYFGKATYINPLDPGNLFLAAEAFMDMEAYDLAAAELNKLLLCKPEKRIEAEVHNALGYIGIKTEDPDKAKHHLSLAIELEPELAVAYYNMGQVARQEGSHALAEYHFKHALEYDSMHVEAWVEMGFLQIDQKEYGNARDCFDSALENDPFEALAYLGLSKLCHKQKDYKGQLEHAKNAFEYDPDHAEICNNLGIAYECNREYDEAEKAYLCALDLNPMHSQAANNLGYLYETKMKMDKEKQKTYRKKAIDAWTKRLQICIRQKKSTKGAVTHLVNLGLSQDKIDELALIPYKVEN